jgi:hypothetical protein
MSVITCPKCGSELAEGALTCARCGAPVSATSPLPAQAAPSAPAAPPSKAKVPVVPLVILGAGILALAAVLVFMRSGGAPPAGEALVGSAAATPASPSAATPAAVASAPVVSSPAVAAPTVATSPLLEPPRSAELAATNQKPLHHPEVERVYRCRHGVEFKLEPDDAEVEIGGKPVGKADQLDKYEFEEHGTYYVKLTHRHYHPAWIKIVVTHDAKEKYAEVEFKLHKIKDHDEDEEEDR